MNTNACQQGKAGYNGRVLTGVSVQTTTWNQGCILIFNKRFFVHSWQIEVLNRLFKIYLISLRITILNIQEDKSVELGAMLIFLTL